MQYVLVVGNIWNNGLKIVGPFDSLREAAEFSDLVIDGIITHEIVLMASSEEYLRANTIDDQYKGFHTFSDDQGNPYGSFEVFRSKGLWFWYERAKDELPTTEPKGPFPTAEGAYLDAMGD